MTSKFDQAELELATQFVCDNKRARDFIWWLLGECGLDDFPEVVNGQTGVQIGMRIVALKILDQLRTADPLIQAKMIVEGHSRAQERIAREKNEDVSQSSDE